MDLRTSLWLVRRLWRPAIADLHVIPRRRR
jgi:hypothetical protein